MPELFTNNASTTLNGAINNSVTSLVLTSASLFPASGNFRIRIDDEIILVTAISGATCTVARGQEGTTAASHADLATVRHVLTAGAIQAATGIIILKTADEDVSTNTTLQDDNHLITPTLPVGAYFIEAFFLVRNPVSTGGNFKFAIGEDTTGRGNIVTSHTNTSGNAASTANQVKLDLNTVIITVSTGFTFGRLSGVYYASGSNPLKVQWAQGTSSGNVVRLYAGSWLSYRLV
jgi:hypothetical protein